MEDVILHIFLSGYSVWLTCRSAWSQVCLMLYPAVHTWWNLCLPGWGGGVEGVHPPAVGYILTNCLSIIHILPCNFIPSPAIKAMIVGFGCFPSIISIYLGSRGWVESVDTDIVVIGNVRIFWIFTVFIRFWVASPSQNITEPLVLILK